MKTGNLPETALPTWAPQPGPQKDFINSDVFEVVYGGARGGGKTDAALGEFAIHAARYGEGARGLLVRRTRVALEPTIARAALQSYLDSTGYQFQRDQGLDAVEQSKAAEGLYNSGAAEKALDAYGSGLAQSYGQQYANDLSSVSQAGSNAINALTGAGIANANQQQANNAGAASVAANADLASANAINALIAKGASAFALTRGQSSFGPAGNAFAPGG